MPYQNVPFKTNKPILSWANHDLASKEIQMAKNVASLPFVYKHVALMPDVHLGKGALVGSVVATKQEQHFGKDVYITRKGAVRARTSDYGIIPGSMGTQSYIVKGKGNHDSYCSCSHGAGRLMSRSKAKDTYTLDDLIEQTAGVECRKDKGLIDEIPAAYKPIDQVMANQRDLVDVVATLKQVICVKG